MAALSDRDQPAEETAPPASRAQRQRRLVQAAYWSSTLADGASRIAVPLYLGAIGVSASNIGLTFVSSEVFGLVASLASGYSLGRFGYRASFLAALAFQALASIGYLLVSPQPLWWAITLISLLRAGHSVGKEMAKTTSTALFKVLPGNERDHNRLDVQILLGGKDGVKGIGMLVGGVLLTMLGLAGAFVVLAAMSFGAFVALALNLPDHRDRTTISRAAIRSVNRDLMWLGVARAFLYAGRDIWLVVAAPLALLAAGVSEAGVGLTFAIGLIVFGLVQPSTASWVSGQWHLGGRQLKRSWRWRTVVAQAPLLAAAVPLALVFSERHQTIWYVVGAVVTYNALAGFATVPHNRLQIALARSEVASSDLTVYRSIAQVGKIVAVTLSGFVYAGYGLRGCLLASAAFLVVSTAAAIIVAVSAETSPAGLEP